MHTALTLCAGERMRGAGCGLLGNPSGASTRCCGLRPPSCLPAPHASNLCRATGAAQPELRAPGDPASGSGLTPARLDCRQSLTWRGFVTTWPFFLLTGHRRRFTWTVGAPHADLMPGAVGSTAERHPPLHPPPPPTQGELSAPAESVPLKVLRPHFFLKILFLIPLWPNRPRIFCPISFLIFCQNRQRMDTAGPGVAFCRRKGVTGGNSVRYLAK